MFNFIFKMIEIFGKYTPVLGILNLCKFAIFKLLKKNALIKFKINHFRTYFYFRAISDESTLPRISEGYFFIKPNFVVNNFVECGSTIGITSLHFIAAYNQAKITLLEPVRENYEILKKNLLNFSKVQILDIGLSNKDCSIFLGKESSEHRSINFSKFHTKDSSVNASFLSINNFFSKEEYDDTDILYININGAEIDLFEDISWLKNCKIVVVYIFNIHQNNTNYIIKKLVKDERYNLNFEIYNFHLIISHKQYSFTTDTCKIR